MYTFYWTIFCAPWFLLLMFGASLFSFFYSNFCSELVCLPFISCVHSLPILFSSVAYNRVLNSPAFSWHVLLEKRNKCGQHTEHFSTRAGRCCTVQSLTVNWRLLVCGDGLSFSDVGNTHWDFTSDFFFFFCRFGSLCTACVYEMEWVRNQACYQKVVGSNLGPWQDCGVLKILPHLILTIWDVLGSS